MAGILVDLATVTQIVPGIFKKNDKTFYIRCKINGTLHYCNKERLDKLVLRYKTIEALGIGYISREANEKVREQKVIEAPKSTKPIKDEVPEFCTTPLPKPPSTSIIGSNARMGPLFSDSWSKCLRPHLFTTNRGYCNTCSWYNICEHKNKMWKTWLEQPTRQIEIDELGDTNYSIETYAEGERP